MSSLGSESPWEVSGLGSESPSEVSGLLWLHTSRAMRMLLCCAALRTDRPAPSGGGVADPLLIPL